MDVEDSAHALIAPIDTTKLKQVQMHKQRLLEMKLFLLMVHSPDVFLYYMRTHT